MRNIPRVTFQGEKKKKKGILDKLAGQFSTEAEVVKLSTKTIHCLY